MALEQHIQRLKELEDVLKRVEELYKRISIPQDIGGLEDAFSTNFLDTVTRINKQFSELPKILDRVRDTYRAFQNEIKGSFRGEAITSANQARIFQEIQDEIGKSLNWSALYESKKMGGWKRHLVGQGGFGTYQFIPQQDFEALTQLKTGFQEIEDTLTRIEQSKKYRALTPEDAGMLERNLEVFRELQNILSTTSESLFLNKVIADLEAILKAGGLTKDVFEALSSTLSNVAGDVSMFGLTGKADLASQANQLLQQAQFPTLSAASGGMWQQQVSQQNLMATFLQNLTGGGATQQPSVKTYELGQLWSKTEQGIKDLAASGVDLDTMFAEVDNSLGLLVSNMYGADAKLTSLSGEFIEGADAIRLYYDILVKLGDRWAAVRGKETTFDAKTGQATTGIQQTGPTFRATSFEELASLSRADVGKIEVVYERLNQELLKIQETTQAAGVSLGRDFKVNVDDANIAVDDLGKTANVTIPVIQDLGKAGRRTLQIAKTFRLDFDTGTVSEALSPFEASKEFFTGAQAQTRYANNLNDALGKLKLTTNDVSRAYYDGNAKLIRITAAQRVAAGVSRQLTVALDEQGNIVQDTSNRYDGFFGALQKNFARVTRWAIATTVIYGALNKLRQIPAAIAEIDQATARLAAISGITTTQVKAYFNETIEVAKRFGIEIQEALPAAEFALQAVGGADQDMAMKLLADSMLLAKITGDDLKTSVDVLTAALSQFNLELDEGQSLIGKWLAVNRAYSVSLTDLARGYATAGSLAQEFLGEGTEALDTFNALIAITAKETALSSRQLGNFLKTVLTSFGSTEVQDVLSEYGISARDSSGQLRNFRDVLYEVFLVTQQFDARTAGALADISRALGGGGSRQTAYVSAVIRGFADIAAVEATSRAAQETSSENYLQFINTLTDNLKDKFQELNLEVSKFLKAFGESNVIPFLTTVTEALINLVKLLESASGSLGGLVPQLAFSALLAGQLSKVPFITGLGGAAKGLFAGGGGTATATQLALPGIFPAKGLQLSAEALGITIAGSLASGLIAGFSAEENGIAVGLTATLVSAVGGLLGGVIGGQVGAMIGITLAQTIGKGIEEGIKEQKIIDGILQELQAESVSVASGEGLGRIVEGLGTTDTSTLQRAAARAAGLTGAPSPGLSVVLEGEYRGNNQKVLLARKFYQEMLRIVEEGERAETAIIEQEEIERARIEELGTLTAERQQAIKRPFVGTGAEVTNEELLARRETIRRKLLTEALAGDISENEFSNAMDRIDSATNKTIVAWDAMSDIFRGAGKDFYDVIELFTTAPEEWTSGLVRLVTEISNLKSEIALAKQNGEDFTDEQIRMNEALAEAEDRYRALESARLDARGAFDLPSFIQRREDTKGTVQEDVRLGRLEQERMARFHYQANIEFYRSLGIDTFQAYFEGFVERIPDMYIATKEGLMLVEGLTSDAFNIGSSIGESMRQGMEESFNVRRLKDIDPSQMGQIEAANRYWVNYLANIRGMTPQQYIQEEGVDISLILGENNVFQKILSTNEAMNFVLQDILDTEKKQLEGMWNIPEGGTFWVPITSLFYQQGQGGGYPSLPPLQDTRTGRGGTIEDAILQQELALAPLREIESFLHTFKTYILDPTRSILEAPTSLESQRMSRAREIGQASQTAAEVMTATLRMLGLDSLMDFKGTTSTIDKTSSLRKTAFSAAQELYGDYRPKPDERVGGGILGGRFATGQQSFNINVTVPEPRVSVESVLTANLHLNGNIIAREVRRIMSRELRRVTYNRRSTLPVRT